ncbi:zeta toxin family protein [Chitinibacter sp. S2-10]|uniref:zeta toxin family protein n=1 Tax=Chitinibacter sp. S2-10 TaxID=3373597 RepID=UPI0039778036
MSTTPRLRLFAGPNGSGKSTIKDVIPNEWLGVYINPDEIEKGLRRDTLINFSDFEVNTTADELFAFLKNSTLLAKFDLLSTVNKLSFSDNQLHFHDVAVNSYFASVLSDFIRHQLLAAGISFTFETVMSSRDKVDFLQKAQAAGFRTYLYFIATADPDINIARVQHRVETGGHPVPETKIRERYTRSLALLPDAVTYANRAYIFDNSTHERTLVAEVTDGNEIKLTGDEMPVWFKTALWDNFIESSEEDAPLYPAE